MNVHEIKHLLKQHGISALKSRGQHFLINERALAEIVHVANITQYDTILEIGPGLGVLTKELALRSKHVIAVEIDKGFIGILKEGFTSSPSVSFLHKNILDFRPTSYKLQANSYKLVGNLPYNISSQILEKFLQREEQKPQLLLVTVQKEFAKRMVALPPHMNRLALLVQYYGNPNIIADFPPHYFWPQPKVHSSLVKIEVRKQEGLPLQKNQEKNLWNVVKVAFRQPRKKLKNSLGLLTTGYDLAEKRPQEVGLEEWIKLAE